MPRQASGRSDKEAKFATNNRKKRNCTKCFAANICCIGKKKPKNPYRHGGAENVITLLTIN